MGQGCGVSRIRTSRDRGAGMLAAYLGFQHRDQFDADAAADPCRVADREVDPGPAAAGTHGRGLRGVVRPPVPLVIQV
jgi:hypothetical protein